MRFCDFLHRFDWSAASLGDRLDATSARQAVASLGRALASGERPGEGLTVFSVVTPLEALVAYFTASHLGLFAAVASPRALPALLAGQARGTVARIVHPAGRALPPDAGATPRLAVDYLAKAGPSEARLPPASARAARLVFSTSGTTGEPKRVVCDERRLAGNAELVSRYLGLERRDRTVCAFPLTFMYGLSTALCSLVSGGELHFRSYLNAHELAAAVAELGASVVPILGDWAEQIASTWGFLGFRPTRLLVLNASDRLHRKQAEALMPFASAFWNNFGQTEAGPRLFAIDLKAVRRLDVVSHGGLLAPGYPVHPGIEVRIEASEEEGGFGAMSYRTPFASLGTWQRDGSIAPAPEWIESGDLMKRSPEGVYLWAGRTEHTLKVKGELMSLRSMTDQLLLHHAVTGVGYAKGASGTVSIFLECAGPLRESSLVDDARRLLRGAPVRLHILPKLPRTESGKVDYRLLSQAAERERLGAAETNKEVK